MNGLGMGAPTVALALGLAGVLPFALGALALAFDQSVPLLGGRAGLVHALAGYAAVILSFLGGVRWGAAFRASGAAQAREFVVGVAPSLVGWFATLAPAVPGLAIQCAAFLALGAFDHYEARRGWAPQWYGRLRLLLSGLVAASLVIAALSLRATV